MFYKHFIRYYSGKGFFITKSELRRLGRTSPMNGMEDVVFTYFQSQNHPKINILEIFAAVITYGEIEVDKKLKLAIYIFDLDGSKYLNKDEAFLLCKSFVRAIGNLTRAEVIDESSITIINDTLFTILKKEHILKLTFEK